MSQKLLLLCSNSMIINLFVPMQAENFFLFYCKFYIIVKQCDVGLIIYLNYSFMPIYQGSNFFNNSH